MNLRSSIPLDQRRGLTKVEATAYAGLCAASFDKARKEGKYPGPSLPSMRWDRRALDAAMDRLSGLGATSDAYSEWRNRRAG
jgi:hypothetical protein